MVCCLLLGCGGKTGGLDGSPSATNAHVVRGSEMSGILLNSLQTRVPSMTVSRVSGECPRIVFRGFRSMRNQAPPSIYVDGTLMNETCILEQISANDVDRVEIYASGNTGRPEIASNPFGVILIYRRQE